MAERSARHGSQKGDCADLCDVVGLPLFVSLSRAYHVPASGPDAETQHFQRRPRSRPDLCVKEEREFVVRSLGQWGSGTAQNWVAELKPRWSVCIALGSSLAQRLGDLGQQTYSDTTR